MTHTADWRDRWRRRLVPALDHVLDPVGLYAERTTGWGEYCLTLPRPTDPTPTLPPTERTSEAIVAHDVGLHRNGLASFKRLPNGHPSASSWTWRYDESDPGTYRALGERQRHYTLFQIAWYTHVFVHDELNPWTSPIDHYNGVDVLSQPAAVSDAQEQFEDAGVNFRVYDVEAIIERAT